MTEEVKKAREQKLYKLRELSKARKEFLDANIFSKLYTMKEENKMRSIFPYYVK